MFGLMGLPGGNRSFGKSRLAAIRSHQKVAAILLTISNWRHTFVAHSQNITMTNLDMNATSSSQWSTVNTDGFDSWNSKDIVIKNWVVTCGDVSCPLPPSHTFHPARQIAIMILTSLGLYIRQRQQQQHPRPERNMLRVGRNVHRLNG